MGMACVQCLSIKHRGETILTIKSSSSQLFCSSEYRLLLRQNTKLWVIPCSSAPIFSTQEGVSYAFSSYTFSASHQSNTHHRSWDYPFHMHWRIPALDKKKKLRKNMIGSIMPNQELPKLKSEQNRFIWSLLMLLHIELLQAWKTDAYWSDLLLPSLPPSVWHSHSFECNSIALMKM